jgi:hypothetical protein
MKKAMPWCSRKSHVLSLQEVTLAGDSGLTLKKAILWCSRKSHVLSLQKVTLARRFWTHLEESYALE